MTLTVVILCSGQNYIEFSVKPSPIYHGAISIIFINFSSMQKELLYADYLKLISETVASSDENLENNCNCFGKIHLFMSSFRKPLYSWSRLKRY